MTMKKRMGLFLALAMVFALTACAKKEAPVDAVPAASDATRSVLRMLYSAEVETFHYLRSDNANDLEMSANLVDCLVEYDSYGVIQPALAERWEPNEDNTVWTFYIRPGVQWVDADGNAVADVTANDWVTAAAYVLDAANHCANRDRYDGMVKNAAAYSAQTAALGGDAPLTMDDVGVRAEDDLTLVYTLESPCPFFPSVLSQSAYMPIYEPYLTELGERFGADNRSILYNGAFLLSAFEPKSHRTLVKNPAYWNRAHGSIERVEWRYGDEASAPERFLQGEIDDVLLSGEVLDAWLADPAKKELVSAARVMADESYFYVFNFEPHYEAKYEPENWRIAVNNENFRHAIRAGLDRVNALTVYEPYNPAGIISHTITPATFAGGGGKDYTQYEPLLPFTNSDSFNELAALNYRDLARDELTAAGATFPIKILLPYNPAITGWDRECGAVEQQLENLLGKDFIDIVVQARSSAAGLDAVRRSGGFALMKCSWRADYADPEAWTDPFAAANGYPFLRTDGDEMPGDDLEQLGMGHVSDETRSIVARYEGHVADAKAITDDEAARYEAFASAEAYLLEHALVIPFSVSGGGYRATRLNVFEGQYAPCGLARLRIQFRQVYETPVSMAQFNARLAAWEVERAAAIAHQDAP